MRKRMQLLKSNQQQPALPDHVAVRYGWIDDAGSDNLFYNEGFPAGPFRTDAWKG
jgi:hypothetical protein